MFESSDYRNLGSSGIRVSPLGLGTAKFGRNQGVKYPVSFDLPTNKHISNLLSACQDLGINLVDTAPAYGSSETLLGELLPGPSDQWIISSKFGEQFEQNQSHYDFSAAALTASVENTLKALKRDYLDILLLHSDGNDTGILSDEILLDTLNTLKSTGKIRASGMSSKTTAGGIRAAELLDVIMVTLDTEDPDSEAVVAMAASLNKGVMIKKPLDSGHDTKVDESLRELGAHPGISSVITGTLSVTHLQENIASLQAGDRHFRDSR